MKLLLSLIKTQFILALKQGRRLLCCVYCDTCGLYPSQKIVQLGRNQDWFVIVLAAELSTDKYVVTKGQNTRGRSAIRPQNLPNRPEK